MPELGGNSEMEKRFDQIKNEIADEGELLAKNYDEMTDEEKKLADNLKMLRDQSMGIDRTKNADGETLH